MESNQVQQQDADTSAPTEPVELSEREREILLLVAGGASNKEVAQTLVISPNTVKVHLRNIFGKIGVSSRTEAALYAVRAGLVQLAADVPAEEAEAVNGASAAPQEAPTSVLPILTPVEAPAAPTSTRRWFTWQALVILLAVLGIAALVAIPRLRPPATVPTQTSPTFSNPPRWEARSGMLTARSRLAVVAYEDQVYAIGGETGEGVTGLTQRYAPSEDTWSTLAAKPAAVADVGAAVIGGLIYVPGGRLASGTLTTTMEAYDPDANEWTERAPLPVALSGYALASFEGRLYLFGGWNGSDFVASVYMYDPADDVWIERTRMPTARGFAAVASASGKIYVIGGIDAKGTSRATEAYVPARDSKVANPWETLPPAPEGHSVLGAATIADTLYVAGQDEATGDFAAWNIRPAKSTWVPLEPGVDGFAPEWLSVVAVQTHVYVLGAPQTEGAASQMVSYQALYTSLIPVISGGSE